MDGSAELEAAEQVVIRWNSSLASTAAAAAAAAAAAVEYEPMLFDGAGDRTEAERFLRAVDNIRRLAPSSPSVVGSPRRLSSGSGAAAGGGGCSAVQVTMARLEDEFRHLLSSRAFDLEIEVLADLTSLSISSDRTNSVSSMDLPAVEEDDSVSYCGGRRSIYRSLRSIREIDLLPDDAVADLRAIASRMAAAGYGRECAQVYASVRKPAVDASLRRLGVERLSIGDVQRLGWDALEAKIRRWIRAARAAVRGVFASERRLSFHVFHDLPISNVTVVTAAPATRDTPFVEAVKGAALQLFGFAEAISIGRRSPEKLFKIIDLHDALSDLLPDVSDIFGASKAAESIYVQAVEIRSRLADAVRGILSEFENAVLRDPPKTAVPGGTIHPLTRYVMNYSSLISEYKATLTELIVSRPSASTRLAAEGNELVPSLCYLELPEHENQSPLAAHIIWIIVVLEHNLESKASLYKDTALSHLFLMNNIHYIVHKVKDSPDLWSMIGDDYLKRLTGKFTVAATNYQRTSWLKILNCLRDEGLHVSGGFSSGISKSALRERFKSFNAAFEDAHRVQSGWFVPDTQLREELRISISEKLLPAYRSFLGRFRHHIENGKHPELYIKHSAEDLENAVNDFFEGAPPSPHNRRKSHG
uniref:Exocyst subunit Exo70 family protein n=2 Tax=Hordeum vulgare subsp. vulgare TaxID=112509 RepID=A0A8I7BJ56_HORVV